MLICRFIQQGYNRICNQPPSSNATFIFAPCFGPNECFLIRAAFVQTSASSIRAIFHYFRRYLEISELGKNKPHQREQLCAIRRNYAQASAISKSIIFSFYNQRRSQGVCSLHLFWGNSKQTYFLQTSIFIHSRSYIYIYVAMDGEGTI